MQQVCVPMWNGWQVVEHLDSQTPHVYPCSPAPRFAPSLQANVTRPRAVRALRNNNSDIVNAILELTSG